MKRNKSRSFEEIEIEHFRSHPNELQQYLRIALEESEKDSSFESFYSSLRVATLACGGFQKMAKVAGLNRVSLYRALSKDGAPQFSTVIKVLQACGFGMEVVRQHGRTRKQELMVC